MSDQSMYEGEFFAGKRCGKGKIKYGDDKKSFYEGEWIEGKMHGYGH